MRRLRPAAAILLLALAACPQKTAAWIAPGSTASDLTFLFGHDRGRERRLSTFIRVDRCDQIAQGGHGGKSMWMVQIDTARITYGETGPGAWAESPARPLTPGCYHVMTTGTGKLVFSVGPDGAVTELDSLPPAPSAS
jgi:hypothetical protein